MTETPTTEALYPVDAIHEYQAVIAQVTAERDEAMAQLRATVGAIVSTIELGEQLVVLGRAVPNVGLIGQSLLQLRDVLEALGDQAAAS